MAGKIRLKISSTVAVYVGQDVTSDEKLKGLGALDTMAAADQVMLCFCLMKDADSAVSEAATLAFSALTDKTVLLFAKRPEAHSAILDVMACAHYAKHDVAAALLEHANLSSSARDFLSSFTGKSGLLVDYPVEAADIVSDEEFDDVILLEEEVGQHHAPIEIDQDVEEIVEESEEFRSKYQQAQTMPVSEKIKMALTGDQEWRVILVRDANKLVSLAVVKNPRITDGEILNIIKVGVQNDEITRVICANKDWVKNHKIRKALVESPKTPLANALRYLATLSEKEIAGYAKSKNISSVVSTQAKRLMMNKKR